MTARDRAESTPEAGGEVERLRAQVAAVRADLLAEAVRVREIGGTPSGVLSREDREWVDAHPLATIWDKVSGRHLRDVQQAIETWLLDFLDTAPASPTTDQRIEARQLTGEHVGREVVLPDGRRGVLREFGVLTVITPDDQPECRYTRTFDPDSVVTLIGGEE